MLPSIISLLHRSGQSRRIHFQTKPGHHDQPRIRQLPNAHKKHVSPLGLEGADVLVKPG